MKELKTNFTTEGFLHNMTYMAGLPELLEEYKSQFPNAESLTLNLYETFSHLTDRKQPIIISTDRTNIVLNASFQKYDNGRTTPGQREVYRALISLLDHGVLEYNYMEG